MCSFGAIFGFFPYMYLFLMPIVGSVCGNEAVIRLSLRLYLQSIITALLPSQLVKNKYNVSIIAHLPHWWLEHPVSRHSHSLYEVPEFGAQFLPAEKFVWQRGSHEHASNRAMS